MTRYQQKKHNDGMSRDLRDGPEVELRAALLSIDIVAFEI
jgi:hypothetical protein